MPEEIQVSPFCPQPGHPLLLSKSEPSLLITSLTLLHLGHANPSCPQAHSRNSSKPLPRSGSRATGATLEPLRAARLLRAPSPSAAANCWCNFSGRYPMAHCLAHLGYVSSWAADSSVGGQTNPLPFPPLLPEITLPGFPGAVGTQLRRWHRDVSGRQMGSKGRRQAIEIRHGTTYFCLQKADN